MKVINKYTFQDYLVFIFQSPTAALGPQHLLGCQKVTDNFLVQLGLLVLRHMARLGKPDPLHLWNLSEIRRHASILSLVVAAIDQQRRHRDFVQLVCDCPVFQRPRDEELRRAVPFL